MSAETTQDEDKREANTERQKVRHEFVIHLTFVQKTSANAVHYRRVWSYLTFRLDSRNSANISKDVGYRRNSRGLNFDTTLFLLIQHCIQNDQVNQPIATAKCKYVHAMMESFFLKLRNEHTHTRT